MSRSLSTRNSWLATQNIYQVRIIPKERCAINRTEEVFEISWTGTTAAQKSAVKSWALPDRAFSREFSLLSANFAQSLRSWSKVETCTPDQAFQLSAVRYQKITNITYMPVVTVLLKDLAGVAVVWKLHIFPRSFPDVSTRQACDE